MTESRFRYEKGNVNICSNYVLLDNGGTCGDDDGEYALNLSKKCPDKTPSM